MSRNYFHSLRAITSKLVFVFCNKQKQKRRLLSAGQHPSSGNRVSHVVRVSPEAPCSVGRLQMRSSKLALVNGILYVRLHLLPDATFSLDSESLFACIGWGREGGNEERVQGGKAAPLTLSRIRSLVGGIETSNGGESIDFPGVFGCQIWLLSRK